MATAAQNLKHSEESLTTKLTIKAMGCDPRKVANEPSGLLPLCRIYGTMDSVNSKESKTIPGSIETEFKGQFEGINLETGEVFRSGRLYLPKGLSDVFESALNNIKKEDAKADVSFAVELSAKKDANPIGYSYQARIIQSAEKVDALAALRAQIKALPVGEPVDTKKHLTDGKGKK